MSLPALTDHRCTASDLPGRWRGEPYALAILADDPIDVVRASQDCLVVVSRCSGPGRVLGLGEPVALAQQLQSIEHDGLLEGIGDLRISADAAAPLRRLLSGWSPVCEPWDWMYFRGPAPQVDPRVHRLSTDDDGAIEGLLRAALPTASVWPNDERALGWWGIRCGDELAGVAAAISFGPNRPAHLASLAVAPGARGAGLGSALLRTATADCLSRTSVAGPMVDMGVYSSNQRAIELYRRHGYRLGHHLHSYRRSGG